MRVTNFKIGEKKKVISSFASIYFQSIEISLVRFGYIYTKAQTKLTIKWIKKREDVLIKSGIYFPFLREQLTRLFYILIAISL